MYEKFTERAKRVMQLANQEAQRFNHEYIGTEHILLGLVKVGAGVAYSVLRNMDVDLRKVRLSVEELVQSGPEMITMGRLPQTAHAKKVLEFADEERSNFAHNFLGTEHLILGLLREQNGIGAQVLMNNGLELKAVREAVLDLLGTTEPQTSESTDEPSNRRRGKCDSPTTIMNVAADLVERQRNFPRQVPLDTSTIRKILVALNTAGRNNVFLAGNRHMVDEYVSHVANLLASGDGPGLMADKKIFHLSDEGMAQLGEICRNAKLSGNMILYRDLVSGSGMRRGFRQMRRRRHRGRKRGFLGASQNWLRQDSIRFVFSGSAKHWWGLCKFSPRLADQFTLVSVPEADSTATKAIVDLGREELQSVHSVEFQDQAIALAIESTESKYEGRMSKPHLAVRVLDYAATNKRLFAEKPGTDEQARLRKKIEQMTREMKSKVDKNNFSRAVEIRDEIEKVKTELLGLKPDLLQVTEEDVRLAIEDLIN